MSVQRDDPVVGCQDLDDTYVTPTEHRGNLARHQAAQERGTL